MNSLPYGLAALCFKILVIKANNHQYSTASTILLRYRKIKSLSNHGSDPRITSQAPFFEEGHDWPVFFG